VKWCKPINDDDDDDIIIICCPWIWNSLPEHVITAATLQSFKKDLKTFLLQQLYSLAL